MNKHTRISEEQRRNMWTDANNRRYGTEGCWLVPAVLIGLCLWVAIFKVIL